jgi:site-specific recombinase XerD
MKNNYFLERDKSNMKKVASYINELPDYIVDFFIGIENQTTPLTRANYAMDLRIFFDYLSKYKLSKPVVNISLENLESLSSSDIESFISYLTYYEYNGKSYHNKERGKSRKLASLRALFKYLFNKEKLSKNITTKVSNPKLRDKDILRLEVDEVSKILTVAENSAFDSKNQASYNKKTAKRDFAMLSVFLGTGLRVSELVGMNVEDIDFSSNAFKVTRKGGNQVVLYFSQEVKDALLAWIEDRENFETQTNALFVSLQKTRITTRAVQNIVKKFSLQVAPLKKISPHKLRSTYGTNLYRETQDIYIVADVLGHKDINTTKKHYAAMSEDLRKSAANRVKLR